MCCDECISCQPQPQQVHYTTFLLICEQDCLLFILAEPITLSGAEGGTYWP